MLVFLGASSLYNALTEGELSGTKPGSYKYLNLMRCSYRLGVYPEFPIWGTSKVSRDHHPGRYSIWVVFIASVHGSLYDYDRLVPILFCSGEIKVSESNFPARTVDIAPTLFAIVGIPFPGMVDGMVLNLNGSEPPK